MVDINALTSANAYRWANARVTRNLTGVAKALLAAKPRYQAVEAKTGVPWWVIAVIHERESSQDWDTHLGQGDPLNRPTTHVPVGRGPFFGPDAWERGAMDALIGCPPYLARKNNWGTPGDVLTNLELYNGTGYAVRGHPSPYVFAGTDQYNSGKFVKDGVFDASRVDPQPGCAALIKIMMSLDPSIKFGAAKVIPLPTPKSSPPTDAPSITNPAKGSIGDFIAKIFSAIFRRK